MNKSNYYPTCVILDLEGTITDCSDRIYYYKEKDYENWRDLFDDDPPNGVFIKEFEKLSKNTNKVKIIVSTAKSEEDKEEVEEWLSDNFFHQDHNFLPFIEKIYYRKSFDNRPSIEVKRDNLNLIRKSYIVIRAYDDREDICDMYKELGISTYLVSDSIYHYKGEIMQEINSEKKEEVIPEVKEEVKPEVKDRQPVSSVKDILQEAIKVYKLRNDEYGSSYKHFGKILSGYFPNGVKLNTEEDFARFGILTILLSKTDRYCKNFHRGGHEDSLLDIINYSSMLLELDQLFKRKDKHFEEVKK